jgi:hypothetical protein
MCIRLSSPRKLVLREGLNGEVALHDAATGGYLAGQSKIELLQEAGQPARLLVTFEIGDAVSLGERARVTARGGSGPELEITGPSRIYRASETAALLAAASDGPAMEALRSIARHTERAAKSAEILTQWDCDGLPSARHAGSAEG